MYVHLNIVSVCVYVCNGFLRLILELNFVMQLCLPIQFVLFLIRFLLYLSITKIENIIQKAQKFTNIVRKVNMTY